MLIPFYLGLIVVLGFYLLAFFRELFEFISHGLTVTTDEIEVFAVNTLDLVMVGNLISMVAMGSVNSFVTKEHGYPNVNMTSGELKNKIATSIVVVSMVHLLKIIFTGGELTNSTKEIFVLFLLAGSVLAGIEHLHHKAEMEKH